MLHSYDMEMEIFNKFSNMLRDMTTANIPIRNYAAAADHALRT